MRKVGVMLQKYIDKYPVPQESVLLCPLGEGGWSVEDFGGDHMGFRRSGGGISQFTANEGKGGSYRAWVGGEGGIRSILSWHSQCSPNSFPPPLPPTNDDQSSWFYGLEMFKIIKEKLVPKKKNSSREITLRQKSFSCEIFNAEWVVIFSWVLSTAIFHLRPQPTRMRNHSEGMSPSILLHHSNFSSSPHPTPMLTCTS